MRIIDTIKSEKVTLSFEVFPPKTSDKFENTYAAAESIARLNPAYISVTYGAGGGRGAFTAELAQRIHQKTGVPVSRSHCRYGSCSAPESATLPPQGSCIYSARE